MSFARISAANTDCIQALGGDLRKAKGNSHYQVAVLKEELRKAAEAYQRDTGNQVAVVSDPIYPAKLMVWQYRSMIEFDDSMRNADQRYSRHGYRDEGVVARLRDGVTGVFQIKSITALSAPAFRRCTSQMRQTPDWILPPSARSHARSPLRNLKAYLG